MKQNNNSKKIWEEITKAALTKQLFPNITDRLELKITVTSNFTTMATTQENQSLLTPIQVTGKCNMSL
jgi:hypothetical protein